MNMQMIEYLKRLKNIQGAPKCKHSSFENYFKLIEKKNNDLAVWNNELYLEYHRGVYTTQANNKKYNRLSENLIRNIEFFNSVCLINNQLYPKNKIDDIWKIILKNQFHDILPGTSITRVHKESQDEYKNILKQGNKLLNNTKVCAWEVRFFPCYQYWARSLLSMAVTLIVYIV